MLGISSPPFQSHLPSPPTTTCKPNKPPRPLTLVRPAARDQVLKPRSLTSKIHRRDKKHIDQASVKAIVPPQPMPHGQSIDYHPCHTSPSHSKCSAVKSSPKPSRASAQSKESKRPHTRGICRKQVTKVMRQSGPR